MDKSKRTCVVDLAYKKREKISCYNHIDRNEFSNCEGNHLHLKLNGQKQKNLCG